MKKEKFPKRILSLLLIALTVMGIFPNAIMTAKAETIPLQPRHTDLRN